MNMYEWYVFSKWIISILFFWCLKFYFLWVEDLLLIYIKDVRIKMKIKNILVKFFFCKDNLV